MSRAVASNFNELWKEYAVRAKSGQISGRTDAALLITLNQKSALSSGATRGKWIFELKSSSTLTAADGRLLWQRQEENSHFAIWLENGLPPDGWNSRIVLKQAAYSLAMTMGDVLQVPPSRNPSEKHL